MPKEVGLGPPHATRCLHISQRHKIWFLIALGQQLLLRMDLIFLQFLLGR